MIEDDVLRQVWTARDDYARLHGNDLQKIVADLKELDRQGDWVVVRLAPRRLQKSVPPTASQDLSLPLPIQRES